MYRPKKIHLLLCSISLLILIYILLIIPLGLANNGEYTQIMANNNLYSVESSPEDQYFNYFTKDFGVYQYYNEKATTPTSISSHNLLIRLAIDMDHIFTSPSYRFDIRFLAIIYIPLFLLGLYLIINYLTYERSLLTSILIGFFAMFILMDGTYILYFNSLYSEALAFCLILIIYGSSLHFAKKRGNPYLLYGLIFTCSVLLIFTKQQFALSGSILGLMLYFLVLKDQRFKRKLMLKINSLILIFLSLTTYITLPQEFDTINQYHAMTRGVLFTADNPEEALESFYINPQYSILTGETYYSEYPQVDLSSDETYQHFFSKYNSINISLYYIMHPQTLGKMLDFIAHNAFSAHSLAVGNYLKASNKPLGTQCHLINMYGLFRSIFTPKSFGFILLWCIAAIALNIKNKPQLIVISSMLIIALLQIWLCIIHVGDADISKRIFLFTLTFDYINLIGLSYVINSSFTKWHPKFLSKLNFKKKENLYETNKTL